MASNNDSLDSLLEEAQKYIIGVSSTQEDFVRPKYEPKSTQASMPKAVTKQTVAKIQSDQSKGIDQSALSAKVKSPPEYGVYDMPSKAAAILEIPTNNAFDELNDAREQHQIILDKKPTTGIYKLPSSEEVVTNKSEDFVDDFEPSLASGLADMKDFANGIFDIEDEDSKKSQFTLPTKSKLQSLHTVVKDNAKPSDANSTNVGHYDPELGAFGTAAKLESSIPLAKTAYQLTEAMNTADRSAGIQNGYVIEGGLEPKSLNEKKPENEPAPADEKDAEEKEDPRITKIVDNSPVVNMLNVGADAMQNAFDAFFYYPATKDGEDTQVGSYDKEKTFEADAAIKELDPSSPLMKLVAKMAGQPDGEEGIIRYFKNIMMPSVVGTRIQSITIPQMTVSTSTVDFLGKTIAKQDVPELNQKVQFSIRTDQNLYLIDAFNYMAGQSVLVTSFLDDKKSLYERIKATSQIPKVWSKMKAFTGGYRLSDPGLCLIVKLRNLGQKNINNYRNKFKDYVDYDEMKKQFVPDEMMPYYVFENIKILGTDDSINFNSGSPSMGQAMNISFIYRRLIRVLISDESETEQPIMSLNTLRNSSNIWWH